MEENSISNEPLSKRNIEERREKSRTLTRVKLHFNIKDDAKEQWRGVYTRNISSDGAAFLHRDFIPLSTKLDIKLTVPRIQKELNIDAKVIRTENLGIRGYLYGVTFHKVDSEVENILKKKIELLDIEKLLELTGKKNATDLHLCVNSKPLMRIGNSLKRIDSDVIKREDLEDMLFNILTDEQIDELLDNLELDASYDLNPKERFRFNIHFQRGNIEATFRRIYTELKSAKELNLPDIVNKLALSDGGLIVVTGKTNSGKTTTAATMLNIINENKESVVITVEDPIEYIYENKKSVFKQREIGLDTKSFTNAVRYSLKQDLDVLFISEITDPDTLLIALRAAEAGHLVIVTFPARDTIHALRRMIYLVPPNFQPQVRMQLSHTLLGAIAHRLYPSLTDPLKRHLATEVMLNTTAIANAIRESNFSAMKDALQTGGQYGMYTLESSVDKLCKQNLIPQEASRELLSEERGITA